MSRTYLFASSRDPLIKYKTTVHDNGAISCQCPARVKCWHIKEVESRPIVGREQVTRLSLEDKYQLIALLREGNDDGAQELLLALFPSMSVEELNEVAMTMWAAFGDPSIDVEELL